MFVVLCPASPTSWAMVGRATETIVASRAVMNAPNTRASRTYRSRLVVTVMQMKGFSSIIKLFSGRR